MVLVGFSAPVLSMSVCKVILSCEFCNINCKQFGNTEIQAVLLQFQSGLEIRPNMKFCVKLGKFARDTVEMFQLVYNNYLS